MTNREKIEALEEVLDCEEGTLQEETELEQVEEWDSMTKLSLSAYMKKEYGHVLSLKEFEEFITVGDIMRKMK